MASVGPTDIDPSAGRPTEHMLAPGRHGGAPANPARRMRGAAPARGFAPPPTRDTRSAAAVAHSRGAAPSGSREVPVYDRATGRVVGYQRVADAPSAAPRGYGASAPRMAPAPAPRAREFDEYEPPAPAYARGGADLGMDDSYVDERWGRPEAPVRTEAPSGRLRMNMRGGAASDYPVAAPEEEFVHGGAQAAYDEAREVDKIMNVVKKSLAEERRTRTTGRAAAVAEPASEYDIDDRAPPASSRHGRADPSQPHSFATCVKGGCHVCLSQHARDCQCNSCYSRSAGRAAPSDAPAPRMQKPRVAARGPRPQDF